MHRSPRVVGTDERLSASSQLVPSVGRDIFETSLAAHRLKAKALVVEKLASSEVHHDHHY